MFVYSWKKALETFNYPECVLRLQKGIWNLTKIKNWFTVKDKSRSQYSHNEFFESIRFCDTTPLWHFPLTPKNVIYELQLSKLGKKADNEKKQSFEVKKRFFFWKKIVYKVMKAISYLLKSNFQLIFFFIRRHNKLSLYRTILTTKITN